MCVFVLVCACVCSFFFRFPNRKDSDSYSSVGVISKVDVGIRMLLPSSSQVAGGCRAWLARWAGHGGFTQSHFTTQTMLGRLI